MTTHYNCISTIKNKNSKPIYTYGYIDTVTTSGEKCVVCGSNLHSPESFPKDFPDRFKLCCECSHALDYVHLDKNLKKYFINLEGRYYTFRNKFNEVFTIEIT